MSQLTDLTWQQIETASEISNLITIDNSLGLMLRLSALVGTVASSKNTGGVVQAMHVLRNACATAQTTANTNQNIGERLATFPPLTSGTPVNGYVMQSGLIVVRTPLANSGISGAVN